jgi:hypothetical protein
MHSLMPGRLKNDLTYRSVKPSHLDRHLWQRMAGPVAHDDGLALMTGALKG